MTPHIESLPPSICICGHPECKTPYGECHCGCGRQTNIATMTSKRYNIHAGEHRRFVVGHKMRAGRNTFPCGHCGKIVTRLSSNGGGYCSTACFYATKQKYKERICCICSRSFSNKNSVLYCSKECFRIKSIRARTRFCNHCGKEFLASRPAVIAKFCTHKCYAQASRKPHVIYTCKNCKKEFDYQPTGGRPRIYCCWKCSVSYRRGVGHPSFLGNRRAYRGPTWIRQAALARERDNNLCTSCGIIPSQKISVDHIIPFRIVITFCEDRDPNDLVNLTCLCRSCHRRKTTGEIKLLRGDIEGFLKEVIPFISKERMSSALKFWGMSTKIS